MEAAVKDLIPSTKTTLKKAIHYHKAVEDDKSLREAFHEAGRALSLVNEALHAAQSSSTKDPQRAINPLRACNTKANIAVSIFKAVAQAPATPRIESYKEAVRKEGKGQVVEVLVVGMMEDVNALAKTFAIQDIFNRLQEAIKKLSEMESSLPKEESGHSFINNGPGEQYNAPDGVQNVNKGSGHIFTGDFSGTVSFGSPPPAPNSPVRR